MTLEKKDSGIFLDNSVTNILNRIDAVIFDCDGVLIDITKSYDLTIIKTTQYFLENFYGVTVILGRMKNLWSYYGMPNKFSDVKNDVD